MQKNKKNILLILIGVSYVITGYFRHIYLLDLMPLKLIPYSVPTDTADLYFIRFASELFFLIITSGLAIAFIHTHHRDKKTSLYALTTILSLMLLVLISHVIGKAIDNVSLSQHIPRFIKNKILFTPYLILIFSLLKPSFFKQKD